MFIHDRESYSPYESDDPTQPRLLTVGAYEAPAEIRLEDGGLHWQPVEQVHVVRPMAPTMLLEFLSLANGEDADVLEYAKQWGVLSLCKKHSMPNCCIPYQCPPMTKGMDETSKKQPDDPAAFDEYRPIGEPISEWRRWSRIARTILDIREKLSEGKVGSDKQWLGLVKDRWFDPHSEEWLLARGAAQRNGEEALAWEKRAIAHFISRWLEIGNVHPKMTWNDLQPEFTLSGVGHEYWYKSGPPVSVELFGALAVQLLENAGRYVITCCSGCSRFYDATPSREGERRPKTGQSRYCKECRGRNAAVRLSQQKRATTARKR